MKKRIGNRKMSGQAIVLITAAFIVLLLFLGVMVDLGQIFIAKGYLRKATDAASLAAAAQFRESRDVSEMEAVATEIIRLNGLDPTSVEVDTCETLPGDPQLCMPPGTYPKKLVRVSIELEYPLTFLRLLNIETIELFDTSISEAASLDLILVIDVSESMAWDKRYKDHEGEDPQYPPYAADPSVCNLDNSCEPFKQVKAAAQRFAASVLDKDATHEEDRLAIVTFATGWQPGDQGTIIKLPWTNDLAVATTMISNLKVYDPGQRCWYNNLPPINDPGVWTTAADRPLGPCSWYHNDPIPGDTDRVYFRSLHCPLAMDYDKAFSACNTTNIGGGLLLAANYFAEPSSQRKEALWVIVLLTDGQANETFLNESNDAANLRKDIIDYGLTIGYCPDGTRTGSPYCIDKDVSTVHLSSNPAFDADDYAREKALFAACYGSTPAPNCGGIKGQGAVIFTIGLGNNVLLADPFGFPYGAKLLRDIAAAGDDGDPATNPCQTISDWTEDCGNYYFAQAGADLARVFDAIASRIFTRLTQ